MSIKKYIIDGLLSTTFIASAFMLSACANKTETLTTHEIVCQTKYANDLLALTFSKIVPRYGTLAITSQESNSAFDLGLEKLFERVLKTKGYSVKYILPLSKRQKGDTNVDDYKDVYANFKVSTVELFDTDYVELRVEINDLLFSRLYTNKGSQPKPVSNWACRTNKDNLAEVVEE